MPENIMPSSHIVGSGSIKTTKIAATGGIIYNQTVNVDDDDKDLITHCVGVYRLSANEMQREMQFVGASFSVVYDLCIMKYARPAGRRLVVTCLPNPCARVVIPAGVWRTEAGVI